MSLFKKAFISSDRGARDDPRPLRQKDPIKADSQDNKKTSNELLKTGDVGASYVDPIYLILKGATPLPPAPTSYSGGSSGPSSTSPAPAVGLSQASTTGSATTTPSLSNGTSAASKSSQSKVAAQPLSAPATAPSFAPPTVSFGVVQSLQPSTPSAAQPPVSLPLRSSSNDAPALPAFAATSQRPAGAAGAGASAGASAASLSPADPPPRRAWGSQEGVIQTPEEAGSGLYVGMRSKAIRSTEHLQDIAPRGTVEPPRISSRNGSSRPLLDSGMKSLSVELPDEAGGGGGCGGDGGDGDGGGAPQPSTVRRPRRQGSRGTGGASVESPFSSSTSFVAASASQRPFDARRRGSREGGSTGAMSVGSRSRADSRDDGSGSAREYYVSLNVSSRDRDWELSAAAAGGAATTGYSAATVVPFAAAQLSQTRTRQLPLVVAHHSGSSGIERAETRYRESGDSSYAGGAQESGPDYPAAASDYSGCGSRAPVTVARGRQIMKLTRVMRSVSNLDGSRVAELRRMHIREERSGKGEGDGADVPIGKCLGASGPNYGSRSRFHGVSGSDGSDERLQGAVERGSISGLRVRGGGSSRNLSAIAAAQCIKVNGESADCAIDAEDGQPQPTLRATSTRTVPASTSHSPVRSDRFTYPQAAPPPIPPPAPQPKRQWRVVRDFAARRDDELDLRIGDAVMVIDTANSQWWKGSLHGRVGYFPSTCVAES